jgi:murein DD-endopeptidase MepM/ murein hydrolase activator NlpD
VLFILLRFVVSLSLHQVKRGDPVALSGSSVSGFAHLHFEVRRDGLLQRNCVNPWMALPYADSAIALRVAVESVQDQGNDQYTVVLSASQPRTILDLNGVRLQILTGGGEVRSTATRVQLCIRCPAVVSPVPALLLFSFLSVLLLHLAVARPCSRKS